MGYARALIGGTVLLTLASCAVPERTEPPQVSLADIRLLEGGVLEQRLRVELRVGNPNNFDLPLDGMTFALELNDRPFAQGFTNRSVTVPRLGEVTVPIVASTTLLDMLQQALAFGQRADLSYRLEGVAYLKGRSGRALPYEKTGRLQLLRKQGPDDNLVPL
ncbi:MAG: LEA type 2 family protein [Kiloniellaceae bacterium]